MAKEIKHDFTNPQFDGQKGIPQGVDNTGPVQNPGISEGIKPNFGDAGNPGADPGKPAPAQSVKGSKHTEDSESGG